MNNQKLTLFIDAMSLVPERKSGVGYMLEQIVFALQKNSRLTIQLVVTLGKRKYIEKYVNKNNTTIKTIPLPAKLFEALLRLNMIFPIDWYLGRGIYLFPNFKNWPLWNSQSITYIHDLAFKKFPEVVHPKNQRYLNRYINRWAYRTNIVIAVSDFSADEITKYICLPPAMIKVVYNGVDHKVFYKRTKKEIDYVKQKYDIPYDKYFMFVGNIEPRKNLLMLLESYTQLSPEIRETNGLVIVGGDGWLNEGIIKKISVMQNKGLKVMKVNQYVSGDDLPALYSGSSLFLQPALYEGFGITPLEAMACEVPVVLSDIPPHREVVDGAGYYFNALNPDSLVASINEALKDKNAKFKIKLGLKLSDVLTWNKSANLLMSIFEGTITQPDITSPYLRILTKTYAKVDCAIRSALGDKILPAYAPNLDGLNFDNARAKIINDFYDEQQSCFRRYGLTVYLKSKHMVAVSLKRALTRVVK